MIAAELLVWVLRFFGALYLVGGLWGARQFWFWARMGPSLNELSRIADGLGEPGATPQKPIEPDNARNWWLLLGALLTAASGAAMLLAHALSVPLLSAVIVHQLFYFIRQRRRELAAATAEDAEEARPAPATVNGFFSGLVMAVLAAWLYSAGALWS
ncbi:MAG: hypothetical protein AB7P07_11150 [Hyphomonadaceae bacterium]